MTIQTSWEMMQQYREALALAKWRKQMRAKRMEQIRLAGDHMRSLRYWLTDASSHRTLRARKAALTEHLAHINALQTRQAVTYCCEIKLVGDSCQNNLRAAISWATTTTGALSFNDWDEGVYNVYACVAGALVQLDVALSKFKSLLKQAKADMNTARIVIDTCAKDILHPVALSKKEKKEIAKRNITQTVGNNYHLVSAAACISQREEGTVLGTKNWLRLVRITRSNHAHRNAHNLNNRQDYLVRLNVDTSKVIRLR